MCVEQVVVNGNCFVDEPVVQVVDDFPPAHSSSPTVAASDDELRGPEDCALQRQLKEFEMLEDEETVGLVVEQVVVNGKCFVDEPVVQVVDGSPPAHSSCPMVAASDDELRGPEVSALQGQLKEAEMPRERKVSGWFDVCRRQCDGVKTLPTSADVLMAPHLARPYKIWVDARNMGAGASLQEDDSGENRPRCFV